MAEGTSDSSKQLLNWILSSLILTMTIGDDHWQTQWVQEDAEETLTADYETHLDNPRAKPGFDRQNRSNCPICQPRKERNPEAKWYLRRRYPNPDAEAPMRNPDVDSEGQINPDLYFMSAAAYYAQYKSKPSPTNTETVQTEPTSTSSDVTATANGDGDDIVIKDAPNNPPKPSKFDQWKPKTSLGHLTTSIEPFIADVRDPCHVTTELREGSGRHGA